MSPDDPTSLRARAKAAREAEEAAAQRANLQFREDELCRKSVDSFGDAVQKMNNAVFAAQEKGQTIDVSSYLADVADAFCKACGVIRSSRHADRVNLIDHAANIRHYNSHINTESKRIAYEFARGMIEEGLRSATEQRIRELVDMISTEPSLGFAWTVLQILLKGIIKEQFIAFEAEQQAAAGTSPQYPMKNPFTTVTGKIAGQEIHAVQLPDPFVDVRPGEVLRYAVNVSESFRESLSLTTKRTRNFNALIYLGLLERELNPHRVSPEMEPRYYGSPMVRGALTDLRDWCYALAQHWGRPAIWKDEKTSIPPPLELPDPPKDLVDKLADAIQRLRTEVEEPKQESGGARGGMKLQAVRTDEEEGAAALALWKSAPIAAFEALRDRIVDALAHTIEIHRQAALADRDTSMAAIAREVHKPLRDAIFDARAFWFHTPIARYLELPEPVVLDKQKSSTAGQVTGSCYHDLGMKVAVGLDRFIAGSFLAKEYLADVRFKTAAGDNVGQHLDGLITQVRCECGNGISKWRASTTMKAPETPGTPMTRTKILFLASNPTNTSPLQLGKEARQIESEIRASAHRDAFDFVTAWAVRTDDLLRALNQHTPTIVHFSGHGGENEKIILENDRGQSKAVTKSAISHLFRTMRGNIRVVVLNACFSQPIARAIVEHIDCVVGMKKSVTDRAAIVFAAAFYRALGYNTSVKNAFDQGLSALKLASLPASGLELLAGKNVNPDEVLLVAPARKGDANP